MINWLKKSFAVLLAAVFCLGLTACGGGNDDPDVSSSVSSSVVENDWRVSGVVRGSGVITRDGEDTNVLVCVNEEDAALYFNTEDKELFDSVDYPDALIEKVSLSGDVWGMFESIEFSDLDGDGNSDVTMCFDDDGSELLVVWIWDPEEGYLFQEDLSTLTASSADISEYVGLWERVGEDYWLRIYENGEWEFLNDQEMATAFGSLSMGETGVELCFDDTGEVVMQLDRAASGDLLDSENGGVFVSVDSIPLRSYFDRYGLEINAAVDQGTYLLKDGVSSYVNTGSGYSTGDCYWEVIKNFDQTHDGIREIQFDAICYIPSDSLGTFNQAFTLMLDSELYDAYSGMWLTVSTVYGNSIRGDNYYVHTIEWNGQSETIEFAYSNTWQHDAGDWAHILTKSYIVYLPEDYDGLIFAAEPQLDNYKDCAKRAQLDSISPEACIMDIDLVDPDGCLFFSICE